MLFKKQLSSTVNKTFKPYLLVLLRCFSLGLFFSAFNFYWFKQLDVGMGALPAMLIGCFIWVRKMLALQAADPGSFLAPPMV